MLCYDVFFKAVFLQRENMLAKMVSDITGIDYNVLENNIILEVNELPIQRYNEKAKRCDFILKIGQDNIINLELNLSNYPEAIIKNLSYVFHLFSSSSKRSEKYNDNLIVTQINLNCYEDNDNLPLKKYRLREEDSHELYVKNLVIYDLNIVNCYEIYYNEDNKENLPNYIKWGAFIYTRYIEDMINVLDGFLNKKERDIIMAGIDKLTHDDLFYTKEEQEEWDRWMQNSMEDRLIKQGLQKGIEQGIEQKTIETIKNMIKKNIDLQDISDITGKTIKEIEKIITENK